MHNYYRSCMAGKIVPDNFKVNTMLTSYQWRASMESRHPFIEEFGFALVTDKETELIKDVCDRPILSLGCGTGYIDQFLRFQGLEVISTDPITIYKNSYGFTREYKPQDGKIWRLSATRAVKKTPNCDVLLSWPCYDKEWAFNAVNLLPVGAKIIYIGEGHGGCTGSDQFHNFLDMKCNELYHSAMAQWNGIHDNMTIYERTLF
jgi:hypothetical protein